MYLTVFSREGVPCSTLHTDVQCMFDQAGSEGTQ